jgi:2-amino-4-hydroxy-6-hydroxymethyldihydropteridine diphosphokinase
LEQTKSPPDEGTGIGVAVYIALGANQNAHYNGQNLSPSDSFTSAVKWMRAHGIELEKASCIWESPAWPDPTTQPPYKNAVIRVRTSLPPHDLMRKLQECEREFGRQSDVRNAPRPLDLDILDYKGQVMASDGLILPHPRMLTRAFVLFPLQSIAPTWCDPQKNRNIQNWIARLPLSDVAPLTRERPFT